MRIVADTNVLVSALLAPAGGPGALLAAIDAGEATLVLSPHLVSELEGVLARDRFRPWVSIEQAESYAAAVRENAEIVDDPQRVEPISRDPDDDYLIALFRAANADVLVTGDEDLTSVSVTGLEILTPRQLLDRLG